MSFGINKGFFISAGIGLLSVAKIIVQGYLDGWGSLNYDISTLWPIILTILSALAAILNAIFNYRNHSNTYSIIQDSILIEE